jgi:hypothetical protein
MPDKSGRATGHPSLRSQVLADPSHDLGNFALDRFRCPDEQVGQVPGEVRHVDLGRVPMERNRLGRCVHSGNFQERSPDGQHGCPAVVVGNVVALHPYR